MTGGNITKWLVEKHPVPIAVYKNNVHKSGIILNKVLVTGRKTHKNVMV
jgi:hypothetical protein